MSYRRQSFTPGRNANMRQYMNRLLLAQHQSILIDGFVTQCVCVPETHLKHTTESNAMRTSHLIQDTLGGRTTFGSVALDDRLIRQLDGQEGQPGGLPRPLRNRF